MIVRLQPRLVRRIALGVAVFGSSIGPAPAHGQATHSDLVSSTPVRSIGPAVMSGRVADIAVAPAHGSHEGRLGRVVYVAAATGGIWKSTNGGTSWSPVLDDAGVGSMGDVTVAPSDPEVVWAGSGEPNNMRSSSYGDGVYKSEDGGESFRHMGLRTSQHIGRIVIHPKDPDVVYVAAVGALWGAGGERGLFRTRDGGETWEHVLALDEHTGVTDVVMDPTNPMVLYAAALQRERRAYSYVGGGPGSGIYKTSDGGDTWEELTNGLPESDMGRIGLDISLSHPSTVYAVIEGSEQGVYRTDNGGRRWHRTSDIASIPWYFGQIRVDPRDPDIVYHLGVGFQRSMDGGRTWERIARQVHVDHHALWINPDDPANLYLGNDGGFYASHDFGESWDFSPNLPISQFYAVGVDQQEPFFGVYGGLQDNSTWGGPSGSRNEAGVGNADWFRMAGGDGFFAAIDPVDPNIAYVESQNGNLIRFNGRTGERKPIRPRPEPGADDYRFNWSAPIKISPHDPATIYFAANHMFKSPDRGNSWTVLGEDLTRAIDRDSLPMMGGIPDDDAVSRHQGTAVFSNISTLDVSSLAPGLLVTGSDDGTVAVSTDDGQTWRKRTDFPGVPDTTYVSKVRWSLHDEGTLYATFDGHRSNDFAPYVLRSTDYGDSWSSIRGDLPDFGNVRAFAEHHRNPDLLFVGTEIAPFASLDGGVSWTRLSDVPPSPVHDMKVHERDNALVIATHGRGMYLVDDLSPLEGLSAVMATGEPAIVAVSDALGFVPNVAHQTGTHADRDYAAENPEYGAAISYYLPDRAPDDVMVEILDASGDQVRVLEGSSRAGLHTLRWDLRLDLPWAGPPQETRGGGGFGFGGPPRGPQALPGQYAVRVVIEGEDDGSDTVLEGSFAVIQDVLDPMTPAEIRELQELRIRHRRMAATVTMAVRQAESLEEELEGIDAALERAGEPAALDAQADSLEERVSDLLQALRGSGRGFFGGGGNEDGADPIQRILAGANGLHQANAPATAQERAALDRAEPLIAEQVDAMSVLMADMGAFRSALDAAGVPWTPGRPVGR